MKMLSLWRTVIKKFATAWKRRGLDEDAGNVVKVVLTRYLVKTSMQDKFREVLYGYTTSALQSTGNIMAAAYYDSGDPCTIWVMERWSNQTYYHGNKKSIAAKSVDALAKNGLAGPVETIFIKDIELVPANFSDVNAGGEDQPVTIMLVIEVQPGTENYFKSIHHNLMPALRNEPGVLFFRFGQDVYNRSRFIVYKQFRNWQLFQLHLKEPALEPIMKFLKTSVKDPPFEKNYHHLIPLPPQ